MKLDDIGDPELVERIARIVFAADPQEEMDFDKWIARCRADEKGAVDFGIFAGDVLDGQEITDAERSDIVRYRDLLKAKWPA